MGIKSRRVGGGRSPKAPTLAVIDELLAFLPVFEAEGFKPTKSWSSGEISPGVFHWPYPNYVDEVDEFRVVASHEFWIDREYVKKNVGEWFKGPNVIERATLADIKSMLTYITRGERFCDGHIQGMIEAGHVVALLRRLAVLRAGPRGETIAL